MVGLVGQTMGRYHILEQLGQGGMATVYRAYDTRLERDVAIKIIRTDQFGAALLERVLKRFEREARALARLSHPFIVHINDYGEHEGIPYLVMDYLPGGTLKGILGRPIHWQEACKLLIPIAQALDYAHEQGLVHRDVKPSNILLTGKGQPMLTDFGIAKLLDVEETTNLTGTGMGVGTPDYMAPEQWTGETSPQTDVYALGVVFYEMVTGRKPYIADTPAAILLKQATDPLPSPRKFINDLPRTVEKVLLKALSRKPADRYLTMAAFTAALEGLGGRTPARNNEPARIIPKPQDDQATQDEVATNIAAEQVRAAGTAVNPLPPFNQSIPIRTGQVNPIYRYWPAAAVGVVAVALVILSRFLPGSASQISPSAQPTLTMPALLPAVSPLAEKTAAQASPLPGTSPTPAVTPAPNPDAIPEQFHSLPSRLVARLGRGKIYKIIFSSDGKTMGVNSGSGIHLFTYPELQDIAFFPKFSYAKDDFALSADGTRLIFGGEIWDVPSQKLLAGANDDQLTVQSAAFLDNQTLAVGFFGGTTLHRWDVASRTDLGGIQLETEDPCSATTFSPDGRLFVIQCWNQANGGTYFFVYDSLSGTKLKKFENWDSPVFSADNSLIAASTGNAVAVWDFQTQRLLRKIETGTSGFYGPQKVAISPDKKYLSAIVEDTVFMWDMGSGSQVSAISTGISADTTNSFSPDGKYIVLGTSTGIKLWDWGLDKSGPQIPGFYGQATSVNWCAPQFGIQAIVDGRTLVQWDPTSYDLLEPARALPFQANENSPDCSLMIGTKDNQVLSWEPSSDKTVNWNDVFPVDDIKNIWKVSYSADNKLAALSMSGKSKGRLAVLNMNNHQAIYLLDGYYDSELSPDSSLLAYDETQYDNRQNNYQRTVLTRLYDLTAKRQIRTISGGGPKFSSDGRLLLTSLGYFTETNTRLMVNDVKTGNLLFSLDIPGSAYWGFSGKQMVFSPDSNLVAIGLVDGRIVLVDVKAGKILDTLPAYSSSISSLVFSPDNTRLASASIDGTILIWDLAKIPH